MSRGEPRGRPKAGEIFASRYRVVRPLGVGGTASVFEAVEMATGRRVALKILFSGTQRADLRDRFRREAEIVAKLAGPHIPQVFDIEIPPDGPAFIALELLTGNDLADEIECSGPLDVPHVIVYATQVARGLAHAHALGVIHRDLKPANIFLAANEQPSGARQVKILDFGISKLADAGAPLTRTAAVFGTPEYMSPEQVRATRDVDARTDIWSLGAVLFECLTGRPPFRGSATAVIAAIAHEPIPRVVAYRADVPAELDAVVDRMLRRDPAERFPSAEALYDALESAANHRRFGRDPTSGEALR